MNHQEGRKKMKTLRELYESEGFQSFISDRLGNDLFINDPERANRIHEYAEGGSDGSYHAEIIQDWRDYLDTLSAIDDNDESGDIARADYDAITKEIDDCELWHEKNNSLWEIVG